MTFTLFVDVFLAFMVGWWALIVRRIRRHDRRAAAHLAEMEEMTAKMREQLPDVLRRLADLPGQTEEQLGQIPTAVVTIAFSPDATAVMVLSPATEDSDEVVEDLDRYWANRAKTVLDAFQ